MSNYTLTRADRATHLKIVAVSLVAAILVVGVGISARTPVGDGSLRVDANAVAVDAAKPVNVSSRQSAAIR